jgi:hypothetical protein
VHLLQPEQELVHRLLVPLVHCQRRRVTVKGGMGRQHPAVMLIRFEEFCNQLDDGLSVEHQRIGKARPAFGACQAWLSIVRMGEQVMCRAGCCGPSGRELFPSFKFYKEGQVLSLLLSLQTFRTRLR